MRSPRDLSIFAKHALLVIAATGLSVLVIGGEFMLDSAGRLRRAEESELKSLTQVLSLQCGEAMRRRDAKAHEELLRSLRPQRRIVAAGLYGTDGKLLADYRRPGETPLPRSLRPSVKVPADDRDMVVILNPVFSGKKRAGTLYLSASPLPVWARMAQASRGLFLVIGISLFVGFALIFYFHRRISRPLVELANTATRISEEGDYSIRVAWNRRDEIGTLYRAFNHLLGTVQGFKKALEESRDDLENRVRERTARLRDEVSRRRKTQRELVRAKEQAEAANRAKSLFLANMSHEIRTPLNTILGFADLLRGELKRDDRENWPEHLEMIRSSGRHLLDLINDILDLSKIEAGQMDVERVSCSPHEIISQVISACRVSALDKHLTIRYSWIGKVPRTVVTDPSRVRQLLSNLVGNAIKFTEFGGVSVVAELKKEPTPRLVIQVVDSGIGIPEEKQGLIFEPFTQADGSVTREFGGTGLGLSISRWIARQLGGDLVVESAPGEGSAFTATIDPGPLDDVRFFETALELTRPFSPFEHPLDVDSPRLPPETRILVVEDGSSNRKLLKLLLTNAGAEVATAENGKLGLEKAVAEPFDLILMDMQMPVMDGYAATPRIREAGIKTPIIALTAHAMKGDRRKCLDAGCDGYVSKPIDTRLLLETILEMLCRFAGPSVRGADSTGPRKDPPMSQSSLYSELPTFDPEFREIVVDFVEKLREKLALMRHALAAREGESLWRESHWVKGSGGTAGFPVFTAVAARLCQAARDADWERAELALSEIAEYASRIDIDSDVVVYGRARQPFEEKTGL